MNTHREASKKGKIYFYGVVLAFLLFSLFIKYINTLFPVTGNNIEQLIQLDNRNLYLAIFNAVVWVALIYLSTFIAISTKKHKQFPPPNIDVPFRCKITPIKNPGNIWLMYAIFLAPQSVKIISAFYFWYESHKTIITVIEYMQ